MTPSNLPKVQFGCGSNLLAGWENRDLECDIRKSLPYADASVQAIFSEHVIEHVSPQQAWAFFEECHRILVPGGVLRVAFPDVVRMYDHMTDEYARAVAKDGFGDGSAKDAIRAAIFAHGHHAAWCESLMIVIMESIGFYARPQPVGQSEHPWMCRLEGHGKVVGEAIARVETSVVEGTKYD